MQSIYKTLHVNLPTTTTVAYFRATGGSRERPHLHSPFQIFFNNTIFSHCVFVTLTFRVFFWITFFYKCILWFVTVGRRQFLNFDSAQTASSVLGCEGDELHTAVFKHHLQQLLQRAIGGSRERTTVKEEGKSSLTRGDAARSKKRQHGGVTYHIQPYS